MATISSLGLGSGLDAESIVTKLAALEKAPLAALTNQATIEKAKISAMGTIQSQFAALGDVASRISSSTGWSSRTASSSNPTAASITVTEAAAATSFNLDVDQLAKEQSTSSGQVATGSAVGAGKLVFSIGKWTAAAGTQAQADAAALAASNAAATAALTDADALKTVADATDASALQTVADATDASALQITADATDATALASAWTDAQNALAVAQANYDADPLNQTYIDALALATQQESDAGAAATAATAADQAYASALADDQAYANALADDQAYADALAADNLAASTASAAAAAASAVNPSFTAKSGVSSVSIDVTASDTVTTLADKINKANAGVVATVFKDGTGERLLLRSKATGAEFGFKVQATDASNVPLTGTTGLARFAFNPQAGAYGMAAPGNPVQYGQNASARINGLTVTSSSNTLTDSIPGVTITLNGTTTSSALLSIKEDVTPSVKNVQDFINAYNDLVKSLADMTKYDAATKTPAIFQGDSAVVGLQSVLRNMVSSLSEGSVYKRLNDIGVERQLDGTLSMNTSKLSVAANNGTELVKLFTQDNKNAQTNGFAVKFAALAKGVLATGGSVANKARALQSQLDTNTAEQTRVNDRAAAVEARLRKQYSALDAKMASLSALNSYVAQQVTTWNKSTG